MSEYSAGPWKVVAGRPGWLYIVAEDLQNGVNRHIAELPASATAKADALIMAQAVELYVEAKNIIAWFHDVKRQNHEQLVLNQTLETASRNWETMTAPPLDLQPLMDAVATIEQSWTFTK